MEKAKKILLLFIGKDKWAEEAHNNKNIVAVESIKTQVVTRRFNKLLTANPNATYNIARAMGTMKVAAK